MDQDDQVYLQDLDEDAALRAIIEGTATETNPVDEDVDTNNSADGRCIGWLHGMPLMGLQKKVKKEKGDRPSILFFVQSPPKRRVSVPYSNKLPE